MVFVCLHVSDTRESERVTDSVKSLLQGLDARINRHIQVNFFSLLYHPEFFMVCLLRFQEVNDVVIPSISW